MLSPLISFPLGILINWETPSEKKRVSRNALAVDLGLLVSIIYDIPFTIIFPGVVL